MGRVRRSVPHSRVPLHRLVRANPELLRRWLVVIALAGCTALVVGRSIADAEAARSRWGSTVPVLVTVAPVEAGLRLDPQVELRRWPTAVAPPGALREIAPDATASVDVDEGVPLTASLVSGADADSEERIQVAVPLGSTSMSFAEGDRVDLWSTSDPVFSSTGGSTDRLTERVAAGAVVVADSDGRHLVAAVTVDEAERVVEALALATVTPVVV